MSYQLIAKTSISIHAPISKVWEGLTKPELIKKYFFGTTAISDWKVGSPITFTGEWEGKTYEDKGTILNFDPPNLMRYNYWSSLTGTEDAPENYANVTYELSEDHDSTIVTVTQDHIDSEEKKKESEQNWGMVLKNMKELLEQQPQQQ